MPLILEITGNKEVANTMWKVFSMLASLISEQNEKLGSYRVISWRFSYINMTAS
jgi:hypothetical protein